jgi:hypothetical protein
MNTKRRLQRIASSFNAKARNRHVPGVVTWEMLATLPGACRYCGIALDLDHGSWDHYTAWENGGDNWITNIVRCCTTCQRSKFTKTEAEYAAHRDLMVVCARPGCGVEFRPRWAEYQNGRARYCSHRCAGMARGKDW